MWIANRRQHAPSVSDGFVGIDRSHALASGLAFFFVPEFGGKLRDLVTGHLAQFPAGVSQTVDGQGRVLLFDGTGNSRLTFPDASNIVRTESGDGLGNFTVAVLANPADAAVGASIIAQGRATGGPDYNQWAMMANSNGFFDSNGTFEFGTIDTGVTALTNNAAATIDGNYHRYLGRRMRLTTDTAGNATLSLFKDTATALATASGTIRNIGVETTSRIILSGYPDGAGFEYSRRVRAGGGWNRALPDALVAEWMRNPYALLMPRRTWISFDGSGPAFVAINKTTLSLTGKSVAASVQPLVGKTSLVLSGKAALAAVNPPANKASLSLVAKAAQAAVAPPIGKTTLTLTPKSATTSAGSNIPLNKTTLSLVAKTVFAAGAALVQKATLTLTGKAVQAGVAPPIAKTNLTLTPKTITTSAANAVTLNKASLVFTAKSVIAAVAVVALKTTRTLTGKTVQAGMTAPIIKTAIALTPKSVVLNQTARVAAAALSLVGKSAFAQQMAVVSKTTLLFIGKAVLTIVGSVFVGIKATMRHRPATDLAMEAASATDLAVRHAGTIDLDISFRPSE